MATEHIPLESTARRIANALTELADVAITAKVGLENFGADADSEIHRRELEVLDRLEQKLAERQQPARDAKRDASNTRCRVSGCTLDAAVEMVHSSELLSLHAVVCVEHAADYETKGWRLRKVLAA